MKTIKVSQPLENAIVDTLYDELDWHICQCNPWEYYREIKSQIAILGLLGKKELAARFYELFRMRLEEEER